MLCRNCNLKELKKIVSIGRQPISSIFHNSKRYNEKKFPLDLFECKNCSLVQLGKSVPLNKMYGTSYGYQSGISQLMVSHLKKKYSLIKEIQKKKYKILDIGSNDGTFLNFFSKRNFMVGIDHFRIMIYFLGIKAK